MSENNNHIDPSDFKKYFSDKMNSDEKIVFENSIGNEDFESEAFEGFQSVENKSEVTAAIHDIENRISKKTNVSFSSSRTISIWKPLAIAASFLFIFGSAFFISSMLKSEEQTLADNSIHGQKEVAEAKEKKVVNVVEDSAIEEEFEPMPNEEEFIEEDILVQDVRNSIQEVKDESFKEKKIQMPQTPTSVSPKVVSVEVDETPIMNDDFLEETDAVQGANRAVTTAKAAESLEVASNYMDAPSVEVVESDHFKRGATNYKNKNFSEAIGDFQKSSSENKNVIESEYYIAMSFYNLNKYNKALKSFDNVIESSTPLSYNAKWYKAALLLNQGKKSESKAILEELANGKSTFKNQAIEKLKTID